MNVSSSSAIGHDVGVADWRDGTLSGPARSASRRSRSSKATTEPARWSFKYVARDSFVMMDLATP